MTLGGFVRECTERGGGKEGGGRRSLPHMWLGGGIGSTCVPARQRKEFEDGKNGENFGRLRYQEEGGQGWVGIDEVLDMNSGQTG